MLRSLWRWMLKEWCQSRLLNHLSAQNGHFSLQHWPNQGAPHYVWRHFPWLQRVQGSRRTGVFEDRCQMCHASVRSWFTRQPKTDTSFYCTDPTKVHPFVSGDRKTQTTLNEDRHRPLLSHGVQLHSVMPPLLQPPPPLFMYDRLWLLRWPCVVDRTLTFSYYLTWLPLRPHPHPHLKPRFKRCTLMFSL